MSFTCPFEVNPAEPRPSYFLHPSSIKIQDCKSHMMIYTALVVVELTCMLVLAKLVLSIYRLLQQRERMNHRINLTHFSYRREVILRPLQETETQGL
ncbi:hypothetical protein FQA47_007482 [Oryzias melastigma]|nr:hypothetical protein FQA47_007482 [Oryzias melastigma]